MKVVEKWRAFVATFDDHACDQIAIFYSWCVFAAVFAFAWLRGCMVLDKAYVAHMSSRYPALSPTRTVRLAFPASRTGMFCTLALAVAATVFFTALTMLLLGVACAVAGVAARSMPASLSMLSELLNLALNPRFALRSMDLENLGAFGLIVASALVMAWWSVVYELPREDLVDAGRIRNALLQNFLLALALAGVVLGVVALKRLIGAAD
jgi:hypothetical protein